MTHPLDYFDNIYCINLDYRKDRWEKVSKEFRKLGIEESIIRVPGAVVNDFDDPKRNACYGNHLSHAACINHAQKEGVSRIAIFEDDVKFINSTVEILRLAIEQLPPWWDLFYFGANLERPAYQVTENLAKLTFAYSTHAYAINMQNVELVDIMYRINTNKDIVHNDVEISEKIIPYFCSFIPIPMVAVQESSYSDIEKRYVDYNWMEDRFNQQLVRKNVGTQT